ncbi:hypothetical protein M3Y97_01022200 [Aphelenchoides bicaudatus]|nr:hypothetical protein M3Y97_01022200 [Aphelenchoides bicaudatus]
MASRVHVILFFCLLAICAQVHAGTWLSFNSEQSLGEDRHSIGPNLPLDVLLDNCRQETLNRASRTGKTNSDMYKLCKTLFDRRR